MSVAVNLVPVPGKCNVANPKRGGKLCGLVAGAGTDHLGVGPCSRHGGSLPSVRRAWRERYIEHQAEQQLAKFGKPVHDADAEQVLLDLVSEAAGNVAWLSRQVHALATEDAEERGATLWNRSTTGYKEGSKLFGPVIDVDGMGMEHVIGEGERAMVKLYGQWADRLAKYAKAAIDAGIEKRRVEFAERQGETIVIVINNVLVQMGLDSDKIEQARRLVAKEFRVLEAGEG